MPNQSLHGIARNCRAPHELCVIHKIKTDIIKNISAFHYLIEKR